MPSSVEAARIPTVTEVSCLVRAGLTVSESRRMVRKSIGLS
jgi:hypothetical protein